MTCAISVNYKSRRVLLPAKRKYRLLPGTMQNILKIKEAHKAYNESYFGRRERKHVQFCITVVTELDIIMPDIPKVFFTIVFPWIGKIKKFEIELGPVSLECLSKPQGILLIGPNWIFFPCDNCPLIEMTCHSRPVAANFCRSCRCVPRYGFHLSRLMLRVDNRRPRPTTKGDNRCKRIKLHYWHLHWHQAIVPFGWTDVLWPQPHLPLGNHREAASFSALYILYIPLPAPIFC